MTLLKTSTFLLGIGAGIIGGATAILFTTPQSGEQLRNNLARNGNIAKEKLSEVKNQAIEVKQSFTTFKNEAKNNIPQIVSEFKEIIVNFKEEIEPETVILKQEIENLQKSIAEIEKNFSKDEKKDDLQVSQE